VAAISLIFLRISLINFVQFKSIKANRDHGGHGVPYVILFEARFFSFQYCGYKQIKH